MCVDDDDRSTLPANSISSEQALRGRAAYRATAGISMREDAKATTSQLNSKPEIRTGFW